MQRAIGWVTAEERTASGRGAGDSAGLGVHERQQRGFGLGQTARADQLGTVCTHLHQLAGMGDGHIAHVIVFEFFLAPLSGLHALLQSLLRPLARCRRHQLLLLLLLLLFLLLPLLLPAACV